MASNKFDLAKYPFTVNRLESTEIPSVVGGESMWVPV